VRLRLEVAVLRDDQRLSVCAHGVVPLLHLAVRDALVHPRLLFEVVVLGEPGGALERVRGLLVAVDAEIREADLDEFVGVHLVVVDGALVEVVRDHAAVHGVDLVRVDLQLGRVEVEPLVGVVEALTRGELVVEVRGFLRVEVLAVGVLVSHGPGYVRRGVKASAPRTRGMRLFVSVDLSDSLAGEVAAVQDELRDASGLNVTDPEQAHVTLKFLGDVAESRVPDLEAALETAVDSAGITPFDAHFGGLGVFPSLDYISVVWLGVERGSEELAALHDAVEREFVENHGFDPEDHDFTPHVTLARMNHAGGKELVQDVVTRQHPEVGAMRVDAVRLTESTLTDDGPEYETVRAVRL
jgi:2'-5' RNA ligase